MVLFPTPGMETIRETVINQCAGLLKRRLRARRAILRIMSALNRRTAIVLAALVLVAAGCGGTDDAEQAEARAAEDARRAAMVSEFESALDEARFLRDEIAALREDMRAVRDAANEEVRRASRDASVLRDEIAAIRLEMQQLSDTAASEAERSAEEARTLRDEIAALRDELTSALEAAESAERSAGDVSAALSEAEQYPAPLVYDDEIGSRVYPPQGRVVNPVRVIYGPTYTQRPSAVRPRGLARDARRVSRSRDARRQASRAADTKPASRPAKPASRPALRPSRPAAPASRPVARPSRPAAPASRPAAPVSRPAAPAPRPAAPAPRPAPVQQKKVHTPIPER